MKPNYLEFVLFDSLNDLYDKLLPNEFLNGKIQLKKNCIEIVFHNEFTLTIKIEYGFNFYVNNIILFKAVDSQDVWELIHSIMNCKDDVYIEWDGYFRRKVSLLTVNQFESKKSKILSKKNIKAYTIENLLFKS